MITKNDVERKQDVIYDKYIGSKDKQNKRMIRNLMFNWIALCNGKHDKVFTFAEYVDKFCTK